MTGSIYDFYPITNFECIIGLKAELDAYEGNRLLKPGSKEHNRIIYPGRMDAGGKPAWMSREQYKKNTIARGRSTRAISLIKRDFLMQQIGVCIRNKISFVSKLIQYKATTKEIYLQDRLLLTIDDIDGTVASFVSRSDFTNLELLFLRNFGVHVVRKKDKFVLTTRSRVEFIDYLPNGVETFRHIFRSLFDGVHISQVNCNRRNPRRRPDDDHTSIYILKYTLKSGLTYPYRHLDWERIPAFLMSLKTEGVQDLLEGYTGLNSLTWSQIFKMEFDRIRTLTDPKKGVVNFIKNLFSSCENNSSYILSINRLFRNSGGIDLYWHEDLCVTLHRESFELRVQSSVCYPDPPGSSVSDTLRIPFREVFKNLNNIVVDETSKEILFRYTPKHWHDILKLFTFSTTGRFRNIYIESQNSQEHVYLNLPFVLINRDKLEMGDPVPEFQKQYLSLLIDVPCLIPLFNDLDF